MTRYKLPAIGRPTAASLVICHSIQQKQTASYLDAFTKMMSSRTKQFPSNNCYSSKQTHSNEASS